MPLTRLEDLTPGVALRGILPDAFVTVVSIQWFGSEAIELTYKSRSGKVANELLYRHDESRLEIAENLDGDRFEGRARDGAHTADVSDLMRRMVKEELLKFRIIEDLVLWLTAPLHASI